MTADAAALYPVTARALPHAFLLRVSSTRKTHKQYRGTRPPRSARLHHTSACADDVGRGHAIDDPRVLQPLPARRAPLADNIGATLAEPLCTSTALPPVDVSAMDGYAVRGNGPWILRPDIQVAGRLHQCVGR